MPFKSGQFTKSLEGPESDKVEKIKEATEEIKPGAVEKEPEIEEKEKVEKTEIPKEIPEKPGEAPSVAPPTDQAAPAPAQATKSPTLIEIENVLTENLDEIFFSLPQDARQAFKLKGEETARTIEGLMSHAKVKENKVLNLIKDWLRMLPAINKFFLEQEAKIKTDKVLKIKQDKNESNK